ncbi:ciliary microtubule associated protein 1B isoform X4 [Balearica regulorum gibbericeps]|uniref:ciliary microtubule associated protein 1B isoform X4 n=1 Tax=Balearica regulorum gibbericeps TaxID=100784 RepID=UPI003F61518E
MSADAWVGSWRPHRPRGPIAALYSSPGPKYGLPTNVGYRLHDPSRGRAPAYSFGVRTGGRQDERSPGPAYLLPPGTTAKGQDGTPAFSIYGRPRDLPPIHTPGPGCYSPERAGRLAFPSTPACSLRSRTRQGTSHQTPGPAAYQLPPMLGPRVVSKSSAPNYSIPGRSHVGAFYEDLCKRAPQYSMLARNTLPGDTTTKPGPGAYSPEQGRQRGLTFGIRHSDYLAPLIVDVPE